MIRSYIYFVLAFSILSIYKLDSDPLHRIFSYLDESFELSGFYHQSKLLLDEGGYQDPMILWQIMGSGYSEKGYIGHSADQKPRLHFLRSDFGSHEIKCYLDQAYIRYCMLMFTRRVIENPLRFKQKLYGLRDEVLQLDNCDLKEKSQFTKGIEFTCQSQNKIVRLSADYRDGFSKLVNFRITLIPDIDKNGSYQSAD